MQPKYSLDKSTLPNDSAHLNFEAIRQQCRRRNLKIWQEMYRRYSEDKIRYFDRRLYSMDGSICLGEAEFDRFAPEFFRRSRRVVKYRDKVHLRGGRYLISGNPTFELRTKLDTFREDLDEGLGAFPNISNGLM
ncbi:hypothetical protein, partial [Pontixanthobacter sp.]|uniref:hypothetical protein n=1 Tax=Pontixanthobacter sp. TaxID=2792078 RepID=UPI003C7E9E66